MAMMNLNLAINTLNATNVAVQGSDAGAKVTGLGMPEALSQGRPTSPGFERFEAYPPSPLAVVQTVERAKRIALTAANLPGKSVRSRDWALPITWATTSGSGRSAWTRLAVSGRADSARHACHHQPSGHDYPSHDRRDDQRLSVIGSALATNRGK